MLAISSSPISVSRVFVLGFFQQPLGLVRAALLTALQRVDLVSWTITFFFPSLTGTTLPKHKEQQFTCQAANTQRRPSLSLCSCASVPRRSVAPLQVTLVSLHTRSFSFTPTTEYSTLPYILLLQRDTTASCPWFGLLESHNTRSSLSLHAHQRHSPNAKLTASSLGSRA